MAVKQGDKVRFNHMNGPLVDPRENQVALVTGTVGTFDDAFFIEYDDGGKGIAFASELTIVSNVRV